MEEYSKLNELDLEPVVWEGGPMMMLYLVLESGRRCVVWPARFKLRSIVLAPKILVSRRRPNMQTEGVLELCVDYALSFQRGIFIYDTSTESLSSARIVDTKWVKRTENKKCGDRMKS
jgi:hypothetical protein